MSFTNFIANSGAKFFSPIKFTADDLAKGLLAYMLQPVNLAAFRAYQRTIAFVAAGPTALVNNSWATSLHWAQPVPTKITNLCLLIDTYWQNTVLANGNNQLTTEGLARLAYFTSGAGADTCPSLDEFAKQSIPNRHLDHFSTAKVHMQEYARFLQQKFAHFAPPNTLKYHKTYLQAVKLIAVAGPLNGAGDIPLGSAKHTDLVACGSFWQKEFAAIEDRTAVADWMGSWVGTPVLPNVLKRLVSDGERTDIDNNRRLAQGPTSFERHKWFYFGIGAPGVGHARELHLTLHGTPVAEMIAKAQNVSDVSQKTSAHGLLKKVNEQDCIGIHEDLLAVFFQKMVKSHKFVK